jgi:polar amino acid transport system permease protein
LNGTTWGAIWLALPDLAHGFAITIAIAALALPLALIIGLVFAVLRCAPLAPVRLAQVSLVEFLRNTPLLLQMFFLYFGGPLIGFRISGEACGVLAIAVQHGAFLSDTFLAGARAVSARQREAAKAIGLGRMGAFRHVLLPQAGLRVLVPIGNQLIIAVKDTAIVSGIGVLDLTLTGKVVLERSGASFEIFLAIGAAYLALTTILTVLVAILERWASPRIA